MNRNKDIKTETGVKQQEYVENKQENSALSLTTLNING